MTWEAADSEWRGLQGALKAARRPEARLRRGRGRSKGWSDVALWQLPRAGEFSADPELCDPLSLIAEFRRHPFADALRELTDTSPSYSPVSPYRPLPRKLGRPRLNGDWPAVYLAYVLTGSPAMQAFYNGFATSRLWQICGFERRPSYQEVYLRLVELESRWEAFATIAKSLIQTAKHAEPRIGEVIFVDGAGWKSPARLEHACIDPDACRELGGEAAPLVTSSSAEAILPYHWAEAEEAEPAGHEDAVARTRGGIVRYGRPSGQVVPYRLFELNGHTYRSLDLSCGLRRYDTGKVWFGGYLEPAVDAVTGLPIAVQVFPADVQEYNAYPRLFVDVVDALGEAPYIVSVDKGFALRPFYEFNTRRGVAVVSGLRKLRNRRELIDWRTDVHDEHGIPRCRHCGGEGDQDAPGLGLVFNERDDPLIRFRCAAPWGPECRRLQTIPCSQEWLMLLPLSRKTELYHGVAWAHSNKEHVFRHARDRYSLAGSNVTNCLRRAGVPPQRLRAWAAVLLDWFRLNLRQGWIEPVELAVKANPNSPIRISGVQNRLTGQIIEPGCGVERLGRMLAERESALTELPYGASWERVQRELAAGRDL